jgi:hypothetical protein
MDADDVGAAGGLADDRGQRGEALLERIERRCYRRGLEGRHAESRQLLSHEQGCACGVFFHDIAAEAADCVDVNEAGGYDPLLDIHEFDAGRQLDFIARPERCDAAIFNEKGGGGQYVSRSV